MRRMVSKAYRDTRIGRGCLVVLLELWPGFFEGKLRVPGDVDWQVVLLWHAVLALDSIRLLDAAENLLELLERDARGDHDRPRATSWSPEVEIVVPADDLREPIPRTEEVEGPGLAEVAGEDAALLPYFPGEGAA